jgi:HAD superfamily hydrolase (TIGR01509 family)
VIRALVFDFDGLILDTEGPIFQSWQELFQSYGFELTMEDWEASLGSEEGTSLVYDNLKQKFGEEVVREAIAPKRVERELELIAAKPILPGVREYIQRAQELGLKLGIASSSSCEWVMGHLEQRGLKEAFQCILGADDVQFTKPHPSLYLTVIERLEVKASQAIAFEDSPNGVTAAKRAGIYCVAVPNPVTSQLNLDHADLQLNSLEDLTLDQLIARVEKERE